MVQDLKAIAPEVRAVLPTSDFDVSVGEPQATEEDATAVVRSHVVDRNESDIGYEVKVKGEWETRSFKAVPRLDEVKIRRTELIFVPKWDFQYEAGPLSFSRRYLASSGQVLVDEIAKCRKCALLKRQTVAVCETCGKPLCDKHSYQEAGWFCEDHITSSMREQMKRHGLMSKLGLRRKQ